MIRFLTPLLAALALAACASTPTYTAAVAPGRPGYSESRIENERYLVTYRANGAAEAQRIEDLALLRAADITLQNNREWFTLVRRTTDATTARTSGPSIGIGVGGGSYGRHSGGGASVGVNFPLGGGGGARATAATLEILLGQGPKPDSPDAYDARALSSSLRTRLMTPQ